MAPQGLRARLTAPPISISFRPAFGSFWTRLVRGCRWTWIDERFRSRLPAELEARVMSLESRDRYHAKQGRSTARVIFPASSGPSLPVYLKRHFRLPWPARVAALLHPAGAYSPGAAEWRNLERVRALGIDVPSVVAAGERIGPWGALQSFLMIAELVGYEPLHEAIPALEQALDPQVFAACKRALIAELAAITATLHRARLFHKDLYLCHFYLDLKTIVPLAIDPAAMEQPRLTMIDLHRLGHHPLRALRWGWKDLGQLLFSTYGVAGIDDRDRRRFWKVYRTRMQLRWPRWQARMIALKAARYHAHNVKKVAQP